MNNDNLKKTITKFVAMAILEADELPFVETAEYVASELISAGIGDVKEAERKAFVYSCEIANLDIRIKEAEHRAKVAEKALYLMARSECMFGMPEDYIEQAEKELSEERKDEQN